MPVLSSSFSPLIMSRSALFPNQFSTPIVFFFGSQPNSACAWIIPCSGTHYVQLQAIGDIGEHSRDLGPQQSNGYDSHDRDQDQDKGVLRKGLSLFSLGETPEKTN
jgi:hypothetical protein